MEVTDLTIKIIVLLLPGIFGLFIIETLTREKKYSLREYITYVIMLGFLSYFLLFAFKNTFEFFCEGIKHFNMQKIVFFESLTGNQKIAMIEVLWSSLISIVVSLIISKIIHSGVYFRLFQKLHITNNTGRDVWGELFHNNGNSITDYVYVTDYINNLSYGGEVTNYSHDSSNPELVLCNARIDKIDDHGKHYSENVDRLYVNLNKNITIDIEGRNNKDEYQKNRRNGKKR